MASTPVFSYVMRRASPMVTAASFYTPADLMGTQLIRALVAISAELITTAAAPTILQRQNSRSLVRKLRAFHSLFEFLKENPPPVFSPSATLCFKELYILFHRSKALLDYCRQSSHLWVLLLNPKLSGYFHDLTKEICTLLDVLPIYDLCLDADVKEQMELLRQQARSSKLCINREDEILRLKIHSFLDHLENSRVPSRAELWEAFVDRLAIGDARCCQDEIEFLEELVRNQEEEVDVSVLDGVIALIRYCRFMLFGFCRDDLVKKKMSAASKSLRLFGESFVNIPKDFCCPISLDLMRDPVTVSSGQTYDRAFIMKWMEDGHRTCPNSGQVLTQNYVVPNHALRNLIAHWCSSNGVAYYPPENLYGSTENTMVTVSSRAATGANKASVELLVQQLSVGSEETKSHAVRELRLLAKIRKDIRMFIAKAGALPSLKALLSSSNPSMQENSITAILNLSIHESNKRRIMEEDGCLSSIVNVLQHGSTVESRENAAATLLSLSMVHEHKKLVSDQPGVLAALASLLQDGTPRGKKDAVMGLYNISTHSDCCEGMVVSGALGALLEALREESTAEEAAGAVALLVRKKAAAERVAWDAEAMEMLVEVMRRGRTGARENAAAAMAEMCRSGGEGVAEVVARVPALGRVVRSLMVTGTKRARRKAAMLGRMLKSYEERNGGLYGGWRLAGSSGLPARARSVSMPLSMYVPVV